MYDNWLCGVDSLRYDEHRCVIDSPTTAEIQLFEIMILTIVFQRLKSQLCTARYNLNIKDYRRVVFSADYIFYKFWGHP